MSTKRGRYGNPGNRPDPHSGCADMLRGRMAAMGVDITVSTARPLVSGPYATDPMTCPHGTTFWFEPTGEQIAAWVEAGVR